MHLFGVLEWASLMFASIYYGMQQRILEEARAVLSKKRLSAICARVGKDAVRSCLPSYTSAAGQDLEGVQVVRALDDLRGAVQRAGRPGDQLAGVSAVGPDQGDGAGAGGELPWQRAGAVAVLVPDGASVHTLGDGTEDVILHRLLARVLRERDQARGQWVGTVAMAGIRGIGVAQGTGYGTRSLP